MFKIYVFPRTMIILLLIMDTFKLSLRELKIEIIIIIMKKRIMLMLMIRMSRGFLTDTILKGRMMVANHDQGTKQSASQGCERMEGGNNHPLPFPSDQRKSILMTEITTNTNRIFDRCFRWKPLPSV